MLVRKKNAIGNDIYAMKILLKSKLTEEGQMENTMTERDILHSIKHPYIVRLRFAFQNDTKLYLVTDYYSGGTLFVHLRSAKKFDLERAKFYGAELVSAISHLHSQHIVYRDLKLENILMDHLGHIALTDFGLSRKDIDKSGGATTFCGTAEYIAPEILTGKQYGPSVDWWGFGVLLYEMIFGKTPFYNKNRKLMFYRIMNVSPSFSEEFSEDAISLCKGLMNPDTAGILLLLLLLLL
jgi:serum/glucocorticoid-regulated kinase 2